jgi:type II secretory pathway component PulC
MKLKRASKANAGSSQPSEIPPQQRQEEAKELAKIFASIFGRLTPEQRIVYRSENIERVAA